MIALLIKRDIYDLSLPHRAVSVYTRFPEITPTNCQIIYNDAESGLPLAIMDATWITEVRTPATALVSIKYGADPGVTTFGMFGCGIQGRANVSMIETTLKNLETIYIYDIFESAMDRLIKECQPKVKAKIVKAKSYEELAKSAQVITSALPIAHKPEPPVKSEWIGKGQTIVCLDCHTVYEDGVYKKADKYYMDSIEQHELLIGYGYYPYGLPTITGETGALAAGKVPGRASKDELLVMDEIVSPQLHRALLALTDEERELVLLHVVDGLPLKLLAALRGKPYDTIKKSYGRAIGRLKNYF